jgi:hypothetical protein
MFCSAVKGGGELSAKCKKEMEYFCAFGRNFLIRHEIEIIFKKVLTSTFSSCNMGNVRHDPANGIVQNNNNEENEL